MNRTLGIGAAAIALSVTVRHAPNGSGSADAVATFASSTGF